MPALPPVPNVLKVQFKGTYNTYPWLNGIYVQYNAGPAAVADLTFLAQAWDDDWGTHIGAHMSGGTVLTSVSVQDLHSADGAGVEPATTKTGAGGSSALPANVAICVSFKQSRRYRGGHPRIYLPPPDEIALANSRQITQTYATLLNNAFTAFKTAMEARSSGTVTGCKWVAVSRYQGHTFDADHNRIPTPLGTPIVREISSAVVNLRLDSQRRRLGR